MTPSQKRERNRGQLRLWPGVLAVVLQWLVWLVAPIVVPEAMMFGIIGGLVGGLAVLLWWAFFSRAQRSERWGAVVLMIVAMVAAPYDSPPFDCDGNDGDDVRALRHPGPEPGVRHLGGGQLAASLTAYDERRWSRPSWSPAGFLHCCARMA